MKWLILILVLIVVGFFSLLPASGFMASKSFANANKSWAPGTAQKAVRIRMLFSNYGGAAAILERAAKTWPNHADAPVMMYRLALCYEKGKKTPQAMATYKAYLARWPGHRWANQAKSRLDKLEANAL